MPITNRIFSFATVTLLTALILSSISAWYSIQGLVAIFAAAVVPIMIMGGALEAAKVVTTIWLHNYWERATWKIKSYLIPAVFVLAVITSLGTFGFLSRAHSDQALISGDVQAKIAVYDQKIQTAQSNIDANRKALVQMDAQVDQLLGRTTDDKGANRAVSVRKQQSAERARLNKEIVAEQELIATTNEQAAPIRSEIRKVEADVGPIKYIAALIYGDNPDTDLMERSVRWVIILIVLVFDPLALVLMLASQSSYKWLEEDYQLKKILTVNNSATGIKELDTDEDDLVETLVYDLEADGTTTVEEPPLMSEISSSLEQQINREDIIPPAASENTHEDSSDQQPITDLTHNTLQPLVSVPKMLEPDSIEEEPVVTQPEIKTDGVTLQETDGGYIQYNGKSVRRDALNDMHPNLRLSLDDQRQSSSTFGNAFPKTAFKGDTFVRIDVLPNRVYKFDGNKWFEITREQSDSYLFNEQYLQYLITKIQSGEYDINLLSDNEKLQIEQFLKE